MIGTPPNSFADHLAWVQRVLSGNDKIILIVEIDKIAAGMITFYDFAGDSVEFGWYIGDLNFLGKGYGNKIMILILDIYLKLIRATILKCVVHNENLVALNIYKKAGFVFQRKDDVFTYLTYQRGA